MLIGKNFKNRYRIYDRLGVGGAATVFLGRDSQTGKMVIVKVVHAHLVNDQFIGRFQREIDLLQQLDNPHIIELYDWGLREYEESTDQQLSFIVAEFVEGHTLADVIDTRAPLPEPDALAIARQILTGLAAVHELEVVHRDVKSQNIMITPSNNVKLIDFGIAKGPEHQTLTRASHFAGTLYYAPPEQILEAASVDHRADLYAVGIVLYEMLSGELPVKDHEMGTVASKIIAGDLDPITGVRDEVADLVSDLLATRPDERIQTARAAIAAIDRLMGASSPGPDLPDLPRPATGTDVPRPHLDETIVEEIPEETPATTPATYVLITERGNALDLVEPETVLGRSHPRHTVSPDIDLWALDLEGARTVSRRHCRIYREDGVYYLEDLGSMNGTYLNGEQLEPNDPAPLSEGDQLAAGRVRLTFSRADKHR